MQLDSRAENKNLSTYLSQKQDQSICVVYEQGLSKQITYRMCVDEYKYNIQYKDDKPNL